MVFARGSRLGVSGQDRPGFIKDQVKEMIHAEVVYIVWGQIPELFGSIKTVMMEFFDQRYVALSKSVAATATVVVVDAEIGGGLPIPGFRQYESPGV